MDKKFVRQQPSQTLARGIQVLEAFTLERPEWGVRELSRELDSNPASIHRIVTTLCNAGYLEQVEETQRYRLGTKGLRLAGVYTRQNPISSVGRKVFEQFIDQFPYNFYLGKITRFKIIYMAALDGHGPLKVTMEPGGTIDLHDSAVGKVLLAFQDAAFIEEFLTREPFECFTRHTITDAATLKQQLEEIRQQGYAINVGEHYEDVGSVAVPILRPDGPPELAVSLTYPTLVMQEGRLTVEGLVPLAREIAGAIGTRLGVAP